MRPRPMDSASKGGTIPHMTGDGASSTGAQASPWAGALLDEVLNFVFIGAYLAAQPASSARTTA